MVEQEIKWEWTDSTVEMIPFGLLAGFYGEKEIRRRMVFAFEVWRSFAVWRSHSIFVFMI